MKKVLLLCLALLIGASAFAQAQIQLRSADRAECVKSDMTSLKASFSFSTVEAENLTTKGGEFSWLSMPNTVIGGNEGDPQIPVINELIAVPVGAQPTITVTSFSTTDYSLSDMGVKTLIPRQPSLRKDRKPEDVPFIMNEAAYQSTRGLKTEPTAVVSVEGTMRGVQLGKMTIEPVSYDPVNNKIRVFNDIEVEVSFDGANAKATEDLLIDTYSPYFDIVYKQLFNGRAVTSVYDEHPDLYKTPVKMLVVTTSTYANSTAFQSWLTWKKQKGIDVDVQTVASGATASTIKSTIYSRYNANHPSFLVIVGDETVVTHYSLWDYGSSYGNAATDLEYASVDGDIYHDMFLSRISVSSTTELSNYVNKALTYEKYTMSDPSYLNNVLLIAGADNTWAPRVGRPTINYAANNYFNTSHGYSNIYKYVSSTYTGCYNYLSSGVGFANYTAHGDIQEWYDPNFTNDDVNNLTNNDKYFLAMGNCCLTANFKNAQNSLTCYGEAMIRAANKGAFGYIGSVPESYWWEDYYFGVGATSTYNSTPSMSNTQTGVYDAMFDDTGFNSMNAIPYIGNVAVSYAYAGNYSNSSSSGCSAEYYWRAYQCFGDGSIMPYLSQPAANNVSHASQIVAGTSSFRVNADARSYVAITVNNEIIGVAAVPENATYVDVPFTTAPQAGQTAMIVVTRNQRQPYINGNVPVINNSAPQYTITANVNNAAWGSVEGAGTYYENTQCTLTAVANHGYAFQKWNDNNTENPRTITVTGNATYTAYFRQLEEHHITFNPTQNHGTISVSPTDAYAGDIVTLTAYPAAGYVLDHWTVTTVSKEVIPVDENNQFVMPDSEVNITATFKIGEPLTVADATGTNSEVPINGLYADDNYQHTQTIYPASLIADMQGCQITKLTYYLSSSVTKNFGSTFEVRLGTTNSTEFSSGTVNYISITGNAAYSGTLSVSGTTVEFNLENNPYLYSGGNLVVDVRITALGSGYNSMSFYGESGSTNYSVKNRSTSSLPTTSGTAVTFMPKTTFAYEAPASCPKPTNLTYTLVQGNGTVANLSWTAGDSETEWTVEYATNSDFTNSQTKSVSNTPSTQLTNLTPETTYYARVIAVCSASDESDPSAAVTFTPTNAYTIVVNNGSTTNGYAPLYGNYKSSYDQMIYTADQLESAGITGPCTITKIGFNSSASNTISRLPVIYICQSDKSSFSSNTDFVSINEFTKVYDYNNHSVWNITSGWNEFELDTPFDYDGSSNLIVAVHCAIASNYSSTIFYTAATTNNQVIYAYSDSSNPDPNTYEGNWGSYSNKGVMKNLPSLQLYYTPISVSCTKPTGLTVRANSLGAHGVTMDWDAEAGDVFNYAIELGTGIDPETVTYAGSITATGTTCSMTWNNLLADSDYTVFIRKDCGNNDYSAAATKIIHTEISCPAPTDLTGTPDGQSANITWTDTGASSYDIVYSTDASADPDNLPIDGNPTTNSYIKSNLAIDNDYYFWVRANCGDEGYSTWTGPVSVHIGYCLPAFGSNDDCITNFTLGDINNTTASSSTLGYGNYTNLSTSLEPGVTATASLTSGSGSGTHAAAVWIDFNDNLEFESSERVGTQGNISGGATVDIELAIPNDAAGGSHRLRVVYQWNVDASDIDPCASATYGEGEDYTIVINSGAYTITCATTTGGTITADKNNADENDVVTITATPEGEYLLTALTYTPEGGSAQNIDITNMPYTFTMPAANVTVNATFSLPACPRPTNLTVSNLAASHATVSWDSEAGNYTVKYSTATVTGTTLDPVFEDGFENGLGNWTTYAMGYNDPTNYNWHQDNTSGVDEGTHTGDYVAMSRSWYPASSGGEGDQSVDNWLVTPQMTLGDAVRFWVACNNGYRDSYAVYVSTGSNTVTSSSSIGDFVQVKSYAEATGTWTEIPVDISAYAGQQGYVAIRHTNTGGDHIMVDDFGVYNTINTYSYGGWTTVSPNPTTESCPLTGLSAETLYAVQVQANCGGTDGSSAWSTIYFTTPDNCGAPQELASSNVTATSATLSWADDKDSYNLQYRKVYFYEDFEGSDGIPSGWTTINNSTTAGSLNWQVLHLNNHSGNNSVGSGSYIYQSTGITPDNWLISPQLDLQGTLRVWLSGYGDRYAEHFEILLSTTGTSVSDFTTTLVAESTTTNSYVEYIADLSSYTGKGYIAIHHFNCSDQNYLCVDDFGIYGSENWVTLTPNPTTETANLTGLTPNTGYEWQVQGVNCDGNGGTTEWSAVNTFETPFGLHIEGHEGGSGKWYLIASPIATATAPTAVENMIADPAENYDLYKYNEADNMWYNYKDADGNHDPGFSLVSGEGYLYANRNTVDLNFFGAAVIGNDFDVTLAKTSGATNEGFNLVGNPFGVTAYIDRSFYTLNEEGSELLADAVSRGIAPMEGVFVEAASNGETLTFSTTAPANNGKGLVLNLSQGRGIIDRAVIRFDESRNMHKFQLFENSTKLFLEQNGEKFAIVNAEAQGEMPVNFKASKNGTYTLSFNTENVEMGYLHLIDNLTGNDVDLLATPSYTFEANTFDYASRFRLVFSVNNANSEQFAFISNGEIVLDGQGTVQVFDVTGRMIGNYYNATRIATENMAAGVYMLQLINGESVKTQKIVVK